MRNARRLAVAGLALTALLASGVAGFAQDKGALPKADANQPGKPAVPPDDHPLNVLAFRPGILFAASMNVFAVANPLSIVGTRVAAVSNGTTESLLFPEWTLDLDAPLPLPRDLLHKIRDGTTIPDLRKPIPWHERSEDDRAFIRLQYEALIDAKVVPAELFKKAGKENKYVTYAHLSPDYRGKVVPVKGKMIRLRQLPIRKPEANAKGIEFVYEGWVVGPTRGTKPYCILFVTLPEGLEPQETMDQPITFYGYYIKKFSYEAVAGKTDETHLLIGPTVYLGKATPAPPPTPPFSRDVLYMAIGGLFCIGVSIVGLHLWFRRGDKAVHSQLSVLRDRPLGLDGDESPSPNGAPGIAAPHEPASGSDPSDASK